MTLYPGHARGGLLERVMLAVGVVGVQAGLDFVEAFAALVVTWVHTTSSPRPEHNYYDSQCMPLVMLRLLVCITITRGPSNYNHNIMMSMSL